MEILKPILNRETLTVIVRYLIGYVGTALAVNGVVVDLNKDGIFTTADTEIVLGAILGVVAVGWGFWNAWHNRKTAKVLAKATELSPGTIATAERIVKENGHGKAKP